MAGSCLASSPSVLSKLLLRHALLPSLLSRRRRRLDRPHHRASVPFTGHKIDLDPLDPAPSRPPRRSSSSHPGHGHDAPLRDHRRRPLQIKAYLIRGFRHLYDGQEAVAVGLKAAITKRDAVITSSRDHCVFLSHGGTFFEGFSELLARRMHRLLQGGSMHFYDGHGIVGAQVPLGCGLAFAQKYFNDVTINLAALLELPVVLVCENNHHNGMGTAEWRSAKN